MLYFTLNTGFLKPPGLTNFLSQARGTFLLSWENFSPSLGELLSQARRTSLLGWENFSPSLGELLS